MSIQLWLQEFFGASASSGQNEEWPVAPQNPSVVAQIANAPDWFPTLLLSPGMIANKARSRDVFEKVVEILKTLTPDEYSKYLIQFYQQGLDRMEDWMYVDLPTVLLAAAQLVRPRNYLEVGVRRGRSLAMVAATQPNCDLYAFDLWVQGYAGMENPGPDFVAQEMKRLNHSGTLKFVSGDSHETLPRFFAEHPDLYFDIVTVDGDHSEGGAAKDILDVLPRLTIGGVLVFDDVSHPSHSYLKDVWLRTVASNPRFSVWQFDELGPGIAIAIRKAA